jgi:hypothetical protein
MISTSIWWNSVEAKRPTGVENLGLASWTAPRGGVGDLRVVTDLT